MKWRIVILACIGVVAALSAAVLVGLMRAGGRVGTVSASPPSEIKIAIAAKPLEAMSVVKADAVSVKTVPAGQRPAESLGDPSQVVGKVLAVPMTAGQPFTSKCFVGSSSSLSLAAALPEGKRAVSLSMSDYAALEGLLYPGCVVDVLVTLGPAQEKDAALSKMLLEGIQVLAVENQTVYSAATDSTERASGGSKRRLVTLMVTCKQAEALQLATEHGSVSLAMRNPMDRIAIASGRTLLRELYGSASSLAEYSNVAQPTVSGSQQVPSTQPIAPPTAKWSVTIIRGSTSQTQQFDVPAAPPVRSIPGFESL